MFIIQVWWVEICAFLLPDFCSKVLVCLEVTGGQCDIGDVVVSGGIST